jgi:hypothetical protein
MRLPLICFSIVALCGCYDPNAQTSVIVREVEAAGSGNMDVSSPIGLNTFFAARPELASRINTECEPLASHGDAHWAETAEGRICSAAHNNLPPTNWTSDGRSF